MITREAAKAIVEEYLRKESQDYAPSDGALRLTKSLVFCSIGPIAFRCGNAGSSSWIHRRRVSPAAPWR